MSSMQGRRRLVAAVDAVLIVGVVIVGQLTHDISPLSEPLATIGTVAPFVAGWVLTAGLIGLYREQWLADPVQSLRSTTAAWLGAAGVGLVLRTSPWLSGGAAWPFGVVIIGTVLFALLPWRLLAWWLFVAE